MNPQDIFCPNIACPAKGRRNAGNIRVHHQQERRYYCTVCKHTFSANKGTIFYRLRTDPMIVMLVMALLPYGCPLQAIVAAYGFDERTIKNWWQRAGTHCQKVHTHLVTNSQLDLQQVQADEIKVKVQGGFIWMALAMMVSTRLWLGGVIGTHRDQKLIQHLANQVRAVALCRPLLLAVDGLPSYVQAFQRVFRTTMPRRGRVGRCRWRSWPDIALVQTIKRKQCGMLTIKRRIVQGTQEMITGLIQSTQGHGGINTAYIERLNVTFRQRLNHLTRRTRCLRHYHHYHARW